jgi:hypothetical protein
MWLESELEVRSDEAVFSTRVGLELGARLFPAARIPLWEWTMHPPPDKHSLFDLPL